jgi:hypothetical protein
MANDGKSTSVAVIGIVLGAVLVYVLYRLMALEKQVREVAASQSTHIQALIEEHIESALASALLEESALPPQAPPIAIRIPIHEVFNSGDISQFIHAAAPRPAPQTKMTVEEVIEEPVVEKPVEPKPLPAEPKAAPIEPKPAPVEPKPAPVEPKPAPAEPKALPAEPKPAPAEPKPAEPQPAPADTKPAEPAAA